MKEEKIKEYSLEISNMRLKLSKINQLTQELLDDLFKLEHKISIEIKDKPQKLLYSWRETEELLGIGNESLRYNLEQGNIKRVKLSANRKPFKYSDILEFVNNLEYIK